MQNKPGNMPGSLFDSIVLTPTSRKSHGSISGLFFNSDYFSPFIMTAIGADTVWQPHFTTVAALNQILGFECMMGSSFIPAGSG
jgi:hypothetical protein